MASKKGQAVRATKGMSLSTSTASEESFGVTTRSKAKAVATLQHATSKLVLLREQGDRQRHTPVINLASLGAPKHVAVARRVASKRSQRDSLFSKTSRERSLSLGSDVDSSAGSYRESPTSNHRTETSPAPSMSTGESHSAQVMTISATSIKEQLAQMNEVIAKLTKIVEEKDVQIATLMSRLESQHDGEADPDPKKNQHDEDSGEGETHHVDKAGGKQKPEAEATLMGSLSIQQLQDMITKTIKE